MCLIEKHIEFNIKKAFQLSLCITYIVLSRSVAFDIVCVCIYVPLLWTSLIGLFSVATFLNSELINKERYHFGKITMFTHLYPG